MADDAVVKVGDIERAIGGQLDVDRAEPQIAAREEIGLFDRLERGTRGGQAIVIDPARHRIPDEHRVAVGSGKVRRIVVHQPADSGRSMAVLDHLGTISQAIMGLAKTGVIRPFQEHVNGTRMAVGGEYIAQGIERHAKRVHLPPSELLDP